MTTRIRYASNYLRDGEAADFEVAMNFVALACDAELEACDGPNTREMLEELRAQAIEAKAIWTQCQAEARQKCLALLREMFTDDGGKLIAAAFETGDYATLALG